MLLCNRKCICKDLGHVDKDTIIGYSSPFLNIFFRMDIKMECTVDKLFDQYKNYFT